jgi:hypothetical protein
MTISKAVLMFIAVIAISTTMTFGASAQTSKPISIQLGVGSATSSSTSDAISSTSFHAGAALALTDTTTLLALPGSEGIDVDYNHGAGNGGHFDAYGATYTNRISLVPKIAQPLTAHVVPYVGFGVGVFQDQVSKEVSSTKTTELRALQDLTAATATSSSSTSTNLGGKLLVGVDTPTGVFVEASYIISGSAGGVRTDSVDLAVGMHL